MSWCSLQEVRRINMNAQGDDHVSFSAAHLALQGQYLLVSTDGPRIIMYNITGVPQTCWLLQKQRSDVWSRWDFLMEGLSTSTMCMYV